MLGALECHLQYLNESSIDIGWSSSPSSEANVWVNFDTLKIKSVIQKNYTRKLS